MSWLDKTFTQTNLSKAKIWIDIKQSSDGFTSTDEKVLANISRISSSINLDAKIGRNNATINGNSQAIITETAARETAINDVMSSVSNLNSSVLVVTNGLASEVSTRGLADTALSGRLTLLEALNISTRLTTNESGISTEITDRGLADTALSNRLDPLEALNISNRLTVLEVLTSDYTTHTHDYVDTTIADTADGSGITTETNKTTGVK